MTIHGGRTTAQRRQADIRGPSKLTKHGLYAVAVERIDRRGNVHPAIEYLKADSTPHARAQFCLSEPNRRTCRIVGVAPAIGYFVDDNHGDKLTA